MGERHVSDKGAKGQVRVVASFFMRGVSGDTEAMASFFGEVAEL